MAYKPNPNREIVDGKAKVSAKELADFQSEYGKDKTLRDLLNADKRLVRRGEKPAEKSHENKVKFDPASYSTFPLEISSERTRRQQKAAAPAPAPAPKPQASEKSLLDKYRESDTAKGFRDARATFGDTPSTDMLMKTGQVGIGMGIGKLLGPAGSAVGAVVKRALKEEVPEAFLARENNPSFNPEKMMDRRSTTFPGRSEPKFNPEKMVDRSRSEPKFNPDKITGRDRPEPEFKKGGTVSGASKRADGCAQRGKTKGRFI